MRRRRWLGSGIEEDFDVRQQAMLDLVLEKVTDYYGKLAGTRYSHRYPLTLSRLMKLCNRSGLRASVDICGNTLTLSRLMKLCNRSGLRTLMTVRVLSHSIEVGKEASPPLVYERVKSERNASHRPYRIFLRNGR